MDKMKTEKEKMLSGEMYLASDASLAVERNRAKDLTFELNNIKSSEVEKRATIIKKLLDKTGSSFGIESPFHCDYGYNIEIGDNFFANHGCIFLDCAKITIGKNVFIGPNVGLYTPNHPVDAKERAAWLEYALPITIGDDVWLGGDVKVMPGVTIGNNVIIGAGSIVTKDVPSNSMACGNPCKVIREI